MGKENGIRILVVDDHAVVREGLAALLGMEDDVEVVGQASNGREAVGEYLRLRPDIALMDLRMPEMDGVAAIEAIRREQADARIIVLTTYDGDADVYRALRAGAQGYLLKDAGRADLLEAIRAVHAGRRHVPLDVAARLAGYVSSPQLTDRELEVLRLLVAGRSNKEIGTALFIAEGTVKAHVNGILTKMGVSDRTQAATLAIRRGIVTLD